MTPTQFIDDFRVDFRDPAGTGQTFSDKDITSFRDKGMRQLYKLKLAKEVSNYTGTYTDMPLAVSTSLDYALPTNWQRVTDVQFWTNTTNTLYIARSGLWSMRERDGYVRIYDGPDYTNYRIMMHGLKKWTGIDDPSMPDEIYDVVLYAAELFAVKSLANEKASGRVSLTSQEATLGAEALWVRQIKQEYKDAVRQARKAMRMIGVG